jgi:hypothetical protein
MSLALGSSAAIGLILLVLAGVRLWATRSRHRTDTLVTEADARAHALPLTKSILSVSPRAPERESADA